MRRGRLSPALLLIAPSLVFMTLLFAWPMLVGIGQAFSGGDGPTLEYLRRMVDDPYFWPAVRNTFLLIVVLIPLQFALALGMALLLRTKPRFQGFYFYIWVIPLAISDLAAGLVWLSIFTDRGYLNSVLELVGIGGYSWLSYENPTTMYLAVLVAELWRATSLVFVILVAGLQGIPKDYDEAAEVFGASYWKRLRYVILPQLRPSIQVAVILRTILALQTFAVAQALAGREFPLLVGETYQWYTALQNPNVAAAIALVVLAISMATSVAYLRMLRDKPGVAG
ncbi:sugar ABC transporter permease [Virgisporangium ochraceum]|jgi:multiple sugar transport system permease protein|uniref:Sugar ABC transporter permease n=1 Tax=Virgisporangium ochraceum TaxID=65505 RepID=A0A8J4EJX8_9ACTN|nr:sugar ABC transporter permease [Virgisporangium ochraceum]GIJ74802.1 sugar ABC transporter permease [Virgisporangium ochraceum]